MLHVASCYILSMRMSCCSTLFLHYVPKSTAEIMNEPACPNALA
jgi:hypothetical protein